jgi:hypothetical protein
LTIIIFKGVDIVLVKVGRALGTVLEMTGTRLLSGARFLKGERGLGEVATAMRGVTLNANEASRKAAIENAVRTGKAVRQAITRNETTMTVINRDGILIFGNGNRVTIGTSEALAMPAHPTPLWFAEGSSSRMAMLAPRSVTAEQTVYDILPMARRAAASDWAEAPVWLDMGAMNSSRARGETLTRIARTPRADSIRATGTPPHKSAAESEAVTFAANMGRPNGAAARAYDTVYDPVAGEVIDLAAKVGPAVASKHAVPIKEVFGNAGDYIPAKSPALPAATRS